MAFATITTGWGDSAPYYNTVAVPGILATDTPHITPVYTNTETVLAEKEAWGMVTYAVSGDGSITFVCYKDKPTVAIENVIGGYVDGEYFVPVRFGLKHSVTGKVTLYLIVDQQKIDIKIKSRGHKGNSGAK